MSEGLNNNFAFASTLYFSSLYIDTHITAASLHDTPLHDLIYCPQHEHDVNLRDTPEQARARYAITSDATGDQAPLGHRWPPQPPRVHPRAG
jgi:hypothetical protein